MVKIGRRFRALGAVLLAVFGLGIYNGFDKHALAREAQEAAQAKASEMAGKAPEKATVMAATEVMAWRAIPVFGQASAKVTVSLNYKMSSGAEFTQTYDYFYRRDASGWVEMEDPHAHHTMAEGGHTHEH